MRTVIKTIITTVLLPTLLAVVGNVEARLKYYRYNDNIPMVEMSLNMMVAMGVLEPIPNRLVHDGNPYHRMVTASYNPYSRTSYSYPGRTRYSDNYRYNSYLDEPISPYDSYYGRYSGNPYSYSPDYPRHRTWGSQWDSPWANRWSNQWDGPRSSSWGNQWGDPWDSGRGSPWGSQWGNPWDSGRGSPWGNQWSNPWNSGWGSPWGNQWNNPWNSGWGSPWGSTWNKQWMNPWSGTTGYPGSWPYTPGYSTLPSSPDEILGDGWSKNNSYQSDDSSRQSRSKDGYKAEKTSWSGRPSGVSYKRSGYRSGNNRPSRKLNGLWIGDNGEMLGIRGNRFLWYDDDNQYAKGQLVKSPTMMKARIDGASTVARYHYKLQANELVIISRNGKMHTFNRMPLLQLPNVSAKPQAAYSSYNPESDNSQVSYTNYGSGLKANKRSLNLHKQSDRLSQSPGTNRRAHSVATREYFSDERPAMRRPHVPYMGNGLKENIESASAPADSGSNSYTGEAGIDDSGSAAPTSTIPLYKQYQPAAGRPKSSSGADSVVVPAKGINVDSSIWNSSTAGLDMDDPNTYLYSYLKDSGNMHSSISAHSGENSSQMNSTTADQGNGDASVMAVKSSSSNIWKPNKLFPEQRQNMARAESALTANSEMGEFTWPDTGSWD